MKCHQAIIREEKLKAPHFDNLFGEWWKNHDLRLSDSRVRLINYDTARRIVEEYEWLGHMPAVVLFCYGIFFDGNCGGVAVYSPEYAENLGVWDKYGFTGKIVLLARGACTHWSPPNTASRLIRQSIRMLPAQYEIVTATVDPMAGEVGTIYQSCGFTFVGTMHEVDTRRPALRMNGRLVGGRALRHKMGHYRQADMKKQFPDAVFTPQITKGRYFCFRGPAKATHLNAVKHLVKPYLKRGGTQ